ncbi:MAG: heme-binding protein [Candidatus Sericytochromatia bacterium]|nr:heme-binding protein [Candidatus Sericytochromatia bacterium]
MALSEPAYDVLRHTQVYELRRYAPYVVAEVLVEGPFEEAGSRGFRPLVRYIGGQNRAASGSQALPMTAPVVQEPAVGRELPMTVPVVQEPETGRHRIQFVMPPGARLADLPLPLDARVSLREVPGRDVAVLRYSGFWSEGGFRQHEARLREAASADGLLPVGPASWARYNQPFSIWFLRRNEVWLPVTQAVPKG